MQGSSVLCLRFFTWKLELAHNSDKVKSILSKVTDMGRHNRYFKKYIVFTASLLLKVYVVLISSKFRKGIQSSISFMGFLLFIISFVDSVVLSNRGK